MRLRRACTNSASPYEPTNRQMTTELTGHCSACQIYGEAPDGFNEARQHLVCPLCHEPAILIHQPLAFVKDELHLTEDELHDGEPFLKSE